MPFGVRLFAISLSLLMAIVGAGLAAETDCSNGSCPADGQSAVRPIEWPAVEGCSYGCCEPLWTVTLEGLALTRSKPCAQTLLVDNNAVEIFNADHFDFPVQFGWDLDVRRRICCDWGIEGRYFGISDRSANVDPLLASNGAGVLYNPTNASSGIFGYGPVNTSMTYASQLQSFEINAYLDVNCCWSLLAGVRYLGFDEDGLSIYQESTCGCVAVTQKLSAFNSLVGFQVGGDATIWRCCCFSLQGDLRTGIYGNSASNRLYYGSADYHINSVSSCHDCCAAFVAEAGLRAAYQLTCAWSIVGGYEFLWIDGVALASQQAAVSNSPVLGPAANVKTSGNVFYNGVSLGVQYSY